MFSKVFIAGAFAVLAAATPVPQTVNQCNTGGAQCCQNVSNSSDMPASALTGLLGVVLQGLSIPVGVGCTPISVVGIADGSSCNSNPVCCDNMTNSE